MMAAGTAQSLGADVTLLEKNDRLGKKLLITGKGRCNITNKCSVADLIANVPVNGRFLYSAFNYFTADDTIDFFEKNGVKTKVERGNRVFPESDKAGDVRKAMERFVLDSGCKIIKGTAEKLLTADGKITGVITKEGRTLNADSVIIATGGKSYPLTGSTGDGYRLAKKVGHTIIEPTPSLVPLNCADKSCKDMQGLSLKNIEIKVKNNQTNDIIYKDFGELLFTHFGLSGPIVLSASAHIKPMVKDLYSIFIDLKPALTEEQLDNRLLRDFNANLNKDVSNVFSNLLPKKMIPVILQKWCVDEHLKCNSVAKKQRLQLIKLLKNLEFVVDGFRPISEAIVTSGGINVAEINPKTMQSKIINGLFFAGEVIDVDAYTGGFNLQIAYSTGKIAGENSAY